MHFGRFLV